MRIGRQVIWPFYQQSTSPQTPINQISVFRLSPNSFTLDKSLCLFISHRRYRGEPEEIWPFVKFWIHAIRMHRHIRRTLNLMLKTTATPSYECSFASQPQLSCKGPSAGVRHPLASSVACS